MAIAELMLTGKATVLVPSPNVAEDHQTLNAKALVEKDAAIMVADKEANEKLVESALQLVNDEEQVKSLETNIAALAKPNAANDIANEVMKLIA